LLINSKTAQKLKLEIKLIQEKESSRLFSDNGSLIPIIGTAEVEMYLKGLIITQTVKISPTLEHSFLLGVDFLSQNSAILDYKHGILSLHDDLVCDPAA